LIAFAVIPSAIVATGLVAGERHPALRRAVLGAAALISPLIDDMGLSGKGKKP
jgi:hypothetical protein